MAFILRKLDNRRRWDKTQDLTWISPDDIPADCLNDLSTRQNALSVWEIDDGKSNLSRVLAALAANRDTIGKLDYALINMEDFPLGAQQIQVSQGVTRDVEANKSWHRNLIELSGDHAVGLGKAIWENALIDRLTRSEVLTSIVTSVRSSWIDRTALKGRVAEEITRVLEQL